VGVRVRVLALNSECDGRRNQSQNHYTFGEWFYRKGRVKSYASNVNNENSNTTLEDGGNKVAKFHRSYYVERPNKTNKKADGKKNLCAHAFDAPLLVIIQQMFIYFCCQ
jgi:hypothetical protein